MAAADRYEELREQYRPQHLRVLVIGESPPDPGSGARRFFYAPTLAREDNLYRGAFKALYEGQLDIRDKPTVLARLRDDGFWLTDAVDEPINKKSRGERRRLIRIQLPRLVDRCRELAPERGVVICHELVYEVAAASLRGGGVRVLDDQPLPFPLGNWRDAFAAGLRGAVGRG